jgi:hypothetical protein
VEVLAQMLAAVVALVDTVVRYQESPLVEALLPNRL